MYTPMAFGTTDMAGKLRLDKPLDPGVARVFQASTERTYRQFLNLVSAARGINDIEEVNRVAQGRVWTGEQARELGLVDKTGSFQDAIEASARIAGLGDDYRIEWLEPKQSAFDEFFNDFFASAIAKLDLSITTPAVLPVSWLQSMYDDLQFIAAQQGKFTIAAHCMCGL